MEQENLNVINSEAMVDKISGEMMSELTGSGSESGSGSGCGSASGSGSGSGEKEPELDYRPLTKGTENIWPFTFPITLGVQVSWGSGKFAYNTTPPSVSAIYIGDLTKDIVASETSLSASWADAYVINLTGTATVEITQGKETKNETCNLNIRYSVPGHYRKEDEEEKEPEE